MHNISAVIITLNEEKVIEKCITSIQNLVDDIVVLDSFSTDKTEDICRSFPKVNFIKHKWLGYAQQKNLANSYAKNDWILSLDADEVLSHELINSIDESCSTGLSGVYEFNRLNNYCGQWIKHSGWYPDKKIRLFNRKQAQWGGLIHEKLEHNQPISFLKGDLLHYTYFHIKEHVAQGNKYSDMGAKEAVQQGKKSSLLKIIVNPIWRFIRDYFFKAGFRDGFYGFVICSVSAYTTFLKYVKIKEFSGKAIDQ